MQLTPHFSLAELTVTSTGLPNTPLQEHAEALLDLCVQVLEPWRAAVGPLRITSGYRSRAVNDALRAQGRSASTTSQHMLGEAADVQPVRGDLSAAWRELVRLVAAGLPVDQAILYVERPPGAGWIHVSHSSTRTRRELLVQLADGHTYQAWSAFRGRVVA